jgi:transposase
MTVGCRVALYSSIATAGGVAMPPKEYGPAKTLYNRWKRWGDKGIFTQMMEGLGSEAAVPKAVLIDATHLKAHRTATSLRSKKGVQRSARPPDRLDQGRHEHKTACHHGRGRSPDPLLHDRRPGQRLYGCSRPAGQPALGGIVAGRRGYDAPTGSEMR